MVDGLGKIKCASIEHYAWTCTWMDGVCERVCVHY